MFQGRIEALDGRFLQAWEQVSPNFPARRLKASVTVEGVLGVPFAWAKTRVSSFTCRPSRVRISTGSHQHGPLYTGVVGLLLNPARMLFDRMLSK